MKTLEEKLEAGEHVPIQEILSLPEGNNLRTEMEKFLEKIRSG